MGKPNPTDVDQVVIPTTSGTLSGNTASDAFLLYGEANLWVNGTFTGSVAVQATPYGGGQAGDWMPVCHDGTATPIALTAGTRLRLREIESGVLYRLVPNLSAGAATWRVSR
jgi:hypothetical protein